MTLENVHNKGFTKRARAHMQSMDQAAKDLQRALNLSPEMKYKIVSFLAHTEQAKKASSEEELSAKTPVADEFASLHFLKPELANERPPSSFADLRSPKKSSHKRVWFRSLAAILCVVFLVGAFALVLQMVHQSTSEGSSPPGLYTATNNSVSRLGDKNGHLTTLWSYTLSAPWTEQRIAEYNKSIHRSASAWTTFIDSPVTVSGNIAYFGGNADDPNTHQFHHYLYALNATNGILLWRYQIDGGKSGIPSPVFLQNGQLSTFSLEPGTVTGPPQVAQDLVYILVASKPYALPQYSPSYSIVALDRETGSVHWTTHYFADLSQMSVASDGSMVYTTDANLLMAFNGENGQKQWTKEVSRPNNYSGFFDLHLVNQTILATLSTYAPTDPTSTSSVYAFAATTGELRWESSRINGLISPLMIDQDEVYFGSETGTIAALSLQSGSLIWSYRTKPSEAIVSVKESGGVLYADFTQSGPLQQNLPSKLSLLALDAHHGTLNWKTSLPGTYQSSLMTLGWNESQLIIGNSFLYASLSDGTICSLSISRGLAISCDQLTQDHTIPSLTLIEGSAG
jgi:outer membrane protein assembly factor BamB